MGVWLGIGVVAIAVALALTDGDSGLRTWWALRGDLAAAQARIVYARAGETLRLDPPEEHGA